MSSPNSNVRTSSNLRTKIVALLVSMAALWAFAAFVTIREGLNLLWAGTLDQGAGRPTESLVSALQQERRLSAVYLGGHTPSQLTAMATQRAQTDAAAATFRQSAGSGTVQWAASGSLKQRIHEEFTLLDGLAKLRNSIDMDTTDGSGAANAFNDIVDGGFRIFTANAGLDDQGIAKDARTLIALTRAQELLSREDALLAGTLAAGRFTGTGYYDFVQLVGAQRFQYGEAAAELPAADKARYQELVDGTDGKQMRQLEDLVIARGHTGGAPPVTTAGWRSAVDPYFARLRDLILGAGDDLVKRAEPVAAWVIVRLILAGGLGLIAVIACVIISITTARALVRQLDRLRAAADELATRRLPGVVERLRKGEVVDVTTEAPPLAFGDDEIGQVRQAFNAVQETAVRVAVEQAELRRGVRDVFLSLARRSQALIHRQLGLLDGMERRAADAEELDDLFRVDHLATRMRRNAENLIVLSGAAAGRGWRNPVAMVDVVRGALAEVEDYTRVTVLPIANAAVVGRAVGDVIHLLAELIENAVSFSPPYTTVNVGGARVANGFAVEIEDRGLGMSEADLADANARLTDPPDFNLTSTARLGLYVVGKLAERHGIRVRLRESPYGGSTAIVLIPAALIVDAPEATALVTRNGRAAIGGGPPAGASEVDSPGPGPVEEAATLPRRVPANAVRSTMASATTALDPTPSSGSPTPTLPTRSPDGGETEAAPAEGMAYTPAGLPWRIRQARPTRPPRDEQAAPDDEPVVPRSRLPEEVRQMMASYQSGTRRGRSAAEHAAAGTPDKSPVPEPGDPTPT
jgi:signal transduction histidine kinase